MLPSHFHDTSGDMSDHSVAKKVWIVQNPDNDLVTLYFNRNLISMPNIS